MKKVLLLIIFTVCGYLLYQQKLSNPYLGEWRPNVDKAMALAATAESDGATEEQIKIFKDVAENSTISITKDKFTFSFHKNSGDFNYKVEKQSDGCFHFTIEQVDGAVGCIENNELALTLDSSGNTQYFIKK